MAPKPDNLSFRLVVVLALVAVTACFSPNGLQIPQPEFYLSALG
jgi:hypothetical protein